MAYDTRLSAIIPEPLKRRLDVFAALQGRRVGHVLAEVLNKALPTDEELAGQIAQKERIAS